MGRLSSWVSYSGVVLITLSQLFLTSPLYRLICPVTLTPESFPNTITRSRIMSRTYLMIKLLPFIQKLLDYHP